MTEEDQPIQGADDGLTPAQSEAVRRLLAGARDDQGIPDDVASRLDAVLADLTAERTAAAPGAAVIPLRRRWPKVLVAAAAVSLFGFGAVQVLGNGAGDADNAGAGSAAEKSDGRGLATSEEPELNGVVTPDAQSAPGATAGDSSLVDGLGGTLLLNQRSLDKIGIQGLRQLSPGTIDQDLRELARAAAPTSEYQADYPSAYDVRAAKVRCGPFYTVSGGETFAALYRRHLALVLFHPRLDGVRLVQIYDCENATPRRAVRTVTLQTGE